MKSSPWFHHKRSESAPPVDRPRDPPSISLKEQDEMTQRLSRPTESALYRQSLYWKLDSYMDRGFHSWSKMDLFDDCKRCMWTPRGTVKSSCKIRPLNVESTTLPLLPPLKSSPRPGAGLSPHRRGDLSTRQSGEITPSALSSRRESRSVRENKSFLQTNSPAVLANGIAFLNGISGSRYRLHNQKCASPSKPVSNSSSSLGAQRQTAAPVRLAVPRAMEVPTSVQ